MWSAKQVMLRTERGRERKYKTILRNIEYEIRECAKHGEDYCYWDGSGDDEIEQRVIDFLKSNGYQVSKDRTSSCYEIAWRKENENAENT